MIPHGCALPSPQENKTKQWGRLPHVPCTPALLILLPAISVGDRFFQLHAATVQYYSNTYSRGYD